MIDLICTLRMSINSVSDLAHSFPFKGHNRSLSTSVLMSTSPDPVLYYNIQLCFPIIHFHPFSVDLSLFVTLRLPFPFIPLTPNLFCFIIIFLEQRARKGFEKRPCRKQTAKKDTCSCTTCRHALTILTKLLR